MYNAIGENLEISSNFELSGWQIAYVARQLRKEKRVTLTCHVGETDYLMEQLNTFSSSSPFISKSVVQDSKVFIELTS